MKRKCKIIFCMMTIALVVCSFALPCFATTWEEISQNQTSRLKFPSNSNWNSQESIDVLIAIAEKGYQIGLFGGGYPFAITAKSDSSGNTEIYFLVGPPSLPEANVNEIRGDTTRTVVTSTIMNYYTATNGTTYANTFTEYRLYTDGSVWGISNLLSQYSLSPYSTTPSATITNVVAIKSEGEWSTTTTSANKYYANKGITNTEPVQIFTSILDRYNTILDSNEQNPSSPNVTYTLDIPGIITAIPNGAKQMINNAYGFEIFGINVAGLLSVVLIVTIVAFVVKWLMSR